MIFTSDNGAALVSKEKAGKVINHIAEKKKQTIEIIINPQIFIGVCHDLDLIFLNF